MTMRKILLFLLILISSLCLTACGEDTGLPKPEQPGTILIDDTAGIFDHMDELYLKNVMSRLTEYGNVCVYTRSESYESTISALARDYYNEKFGTSSGFLFIIDFSSRNLYIETDGYIGARITRDKALTIADNIYSYATREQYTKCVENAIDQAVRIMQERHIPQTMRIASSVFIAILCGLLINFTVLRMLNRKPAVTIGEMSIGVKGNTKFSDEKITTVDRHYQDAPITKTRVILTILRILLIILSSGGSSKGGKSGGSGGGHSSHGGGHRF